MQKRQFKKNVGLKLVKLPDADAKANSSHKKMKIATFTMLSKKFNCYQ